jgi:hypothetical protein
MILPGEELARLKRPAERAGFMGKPATVMESKMKNLKANWRCLLCSGGNGYGCVSRTKNLAEYTGAKLLAENRVTAQCSSTPPKTTRTHLTNE